MYFKSSNQPITTPIIIAIKKTDIAKNMYKIHFYVSNILIINLIEVSHEGLIKLFVIANNIKYHNNGVKIYDNQDNDYIVYKNTDTDSIISIKRQTMIEMIDLYHL